MEIALWIALALSVGATVVFATMVVNAQRRILEHDEQFNAVLIALQTARSTVENQKDEILLTVKDHAEKLESVRVAERNRYEQKEAKYIAQIQGLADRLAKLKISTPTEEGVVITDGEVDFRPEPEVEPYSPELFAFLRGVEGDEARLLVEDYIEARRTAGCYDEQILTELKRGEYA